MKKVFKYLRHSMLLAAVALFAFSCAESEVVEGKLNTPSDSAFTASTLSFDFGYEGGSSPITITAPAIWNADSDAEWCYPSLVSGNDGVSQLYIMAAANTEGKARTATITLTATNVEPIVLAVSQAGAPTDPNLVVAQPDQWDGHSRDEMIYEILVYAFADSNGDGYGDFQGIISKLDYIEQLGAGGLWLSPIHPSDSYHGYDVTDYNGIHPKFGTKEDFRQLVEACHQRGIKVYLDYVVNHTGKGHPWYTQALEGYKKGEKNEYWNYYMLSENPAGDVAAGVFPMLTPKYNYSYGSDHWKNIDGWPVPEATTHRYKFTLDWSAKTIKVEPTEEAVSAENTDEAVQKYIYYGESGAHYRMYDMGNNIFELVVDFHSPWGFLVKTGTSWDGTKYGSKSGDYLVEGQPHELALDAGDIQFEYMRTLKVYARLFSAWMPDLNYGEISTVQQSAPYRHILESIKGWLDLGVDGLRVDAAKHVYFEDFGSANQEFWRKLYGDANAYYKTKPQADGEMYLVAELFSGMGENKVYADDIPSFFNFDFWWQSLDPIKNGQGKGIAQNLLNLQNQALAVNRNFIDAVKLTNHDEPRAMHDLGDNRHLARVVGSMLLTLSGRPVVYYGEELGYSGTNSGQPDTNVRQPMKWSKTEYAKYSGALDVSFANVKSVEFLLEDEMSILNAYRKFGQLRRIYPSLTEKGKLVPAYKEAGDPASLAGWYRQLGNETLLVLHNIGGKEISFKLYETIEKCVAVMGEVKKVGDQLTMPAYSTVIFKVTKDQL